MILVLALLFLAVIAFFISAAVKAQRRMQYADTRSAMRTIASGSSRPPSWTRDSKRVEEFLYVVKNLAVHKGVPLVFASQATETMTNASLALAHCAGAMEAEGASFNAQKMASADLLFSLWSKSSAEQRQTLLMKPEDDEGLEDQGMSVDDFQARLDDLTKRLFIDNENRSANMPNRTEDDVDNGAEKYLNSDDFNAPKTFVGRFYSEFDSLSGVELRQEEIGPSWVYDREKVKRFASYVVQQSMRLGVAETYVMMLLLHKDLQNMILACTACAENQNFDFKFQKDIGVAIIKRAWDDADESTRDQAESMTLDSDAMDHICNNQD